MGLPQITYNGRTIAFPYNIYAIQQEYPGDVLNAASASNIVQILNVSPDVLITLAARLFENANGAHATFKRNMYQWFEWARQGFAWQFAADSAKTAMTTISAGAAAGASSIVVTSAAGLSIGDGCMLKSLTQQEVVKISNISGTTISLTETLLFGYASGSRFRHEQYWPARLGDFSGVMSSSSTSATMIKKHPVREKPPLHFDIELMLMEDMN